MAEHKSRKQEMDNRLKMEFETMKKKLRDEFELINFILKKSVH